MLFEGASFIMDAKGDVQHRAPQFLECVALTRWRKTENAWQCEGGPLADWTGGSELVYRAITMAVRDYVEKNHFKGVVIGLSGGVDSALTAAIAVDALGAARVHCVMMPSRYTSTESFEDAEKCAKNLGVSYRVIDIEPGVAAFDEMLATTFHNLEKIQLKKIFSRAFAAAC